MTQTLLLHSLMRDSGTDDRNGVPRFAPTALTSAANGQFCSCDSFRSIILTRLFLTCRISAHCHQQAQQTCHALLSSQWAGRASKEYRARIASLLRQGDDLNQSARAVISAVQNVSHL